MKGQSGKIILVAGDQSLEWFEITTPPPEKQAGNQTVKYQWQTDPGFGRISKPGGALLIADFLKYVPDIETKIPPIQTGIPGHTPWSLQAFASLDLFPYSIRKPGREVYRIKEWKGVVGKGSIEHESYELKDIESDLVVLNDSGNGFRDNKEVCRAILKSNPSLIIMNMSYQLGQGYLWDEIRKSDLPLLLIVEADELRLMDVKISRCLSWERTAQDLTWQMAYNRNVQFLKEADFLVIRFGADGAVFYNNRIKAYKPQLFYDPKAGEEGFASVCPGSMSGLSEVFAATLAAELKIDQLEEQIPAAICRSLTSMKRLWRAGFGDDIEALDYQYSGLFDHNKTDDFIIASVDLPDTTPQPDQLYWCILEELPAFVEMIAVNSVITGKDESLAKVPLGQYGNLVTMDRSEIESFNSIRNLVREYLNSPAVKRPLSIGVFGPPGSGKSFGVTEVVKSIDPDKVPKEPLEFNLSQFKSQEELVTVFHKVRDIALQGITPLVFFDEFDSELRGEKLGWLKYFLAPMQDGLFRDGENMHPIGKAIFVFAGGTRSTYEEFSSQEESQSFKDAKGSDFISRLRGYINIKGPNPISGDMAKDRLAMIRRATVLRFLLAKHAPGIFTAQKICRIDKGVLQAFIKVPHYKHGIRSMQSIIEMSSLAGRHKFEQAALPSPDQLKLHVDAAVFQKIVVREVIFNAARERIAQAIHESYQETFQNEKAADEPSMLPWNKLSEELKLSNLGQADHILDKLQSINCDFIPVTEQEVKVFDFCPDELEFMAQQEHERFMDEKIRQGWVQGEVRDNDKKIRTDLLPWLELPDEIKEYDRNAVRVIPELMAMAGLEIYRMK